jgi:hypothetical protein
MVLFQDSPLHIGYQMILPFTPSLIETSNGDLFWKTKKIIRQRGMFLPWWHFIAAILLLSQL